MHVTILGKMRGDSPVATSQMNGSEGAPHYVHKTMPHSNKESSRQGCRSVTHEWWFVDPAWLVPFLVLVAGMVVAICMPGGYSFDEISHIARVEQLAAGQVKPAPVALDDGRTYPFGYSEDSTLYGGEMDKALYDVVLAGNNSVSELATRTEGFAFPWWTDDYFPTSEQVGQASVATTFSNTSINSPINYLPQLIGYVLVGPFTSSPVVLIIAMRIAGLLAFVCALHFAMLLTPFGKWTLGYLALFPVWIRTAAVVTADTMTLICTLLYFVAILRMVFNEDTPRRSDWVVLTVFGIGLCLCKVSYLPFGILLFAPLVARSRFRSRARVLAMAVIAASGLLAFTIWYANIAGINTGAMWSETIDPDAQLEYILANPVSFVHSFADVMAQMDFLFVRPTLFQSGPDISSSWFVLALLVAFTADILSAYSTCSGGSSAVVMLIFVLIVATISSALIVLALDLQFNEVGATVIQGVQQRYFIPLAFPLYCVLLLVAASACSGLRSGDGEVVYAEKPNIVPSLAMILLCVMNVALIGVSIY